MLASVNLQNLPLLPKRKKNRCNSSVTTIPSTVEATPLFAGYSFSWISQIALADADGLFVEGRGPGRGGMQSAKAKADASQRKAKVWPTPSAPRHPRFAVVVHDAGRRGGNPMLPTRCLPPKLRAPACIFVPRAPRVSPTSLVPCLVRTALVVTLRPGH